ncbi:MAG: RnfH family protein [Methylococcales bacterium]
MAPEQMPMLAVQVAYAKPERQALIDVKLPEGSNVEQAIVASGLLAQFPELDLATLTVGIFGKVCGLEQILKPADRVEIYRLLHNDPKDARRQRAAKR